MAELLIDIHKNLPIFSSMYTELNHTTEVANEILALIEPQTVIVDGENIVYTPCKEIAKLLPVVNTLKTLSLKAEATDIDAFHLEAHISLFVRQLKGQADFYDSDKVPHKLEKMLEGSVLVGAVVDSLLFATAYYFDLPLATDWALLLSLILHPTCAGIKAGTSYEDGRLQPWKCLTGRFEDVWIRDGGRFYKADREEMVLSVMKAGEKVLREEIETQIDIDELARAATGKNNPAKKSSSC